MRKKNENWQTVWSLFLSGKLHVFYSPTMPMCKSLIWTYIHDRSYRRKTLATPHYKNLTTGPNQAGTIFGLFRCLVLVFSLDKQIGNIVKKLNTVLWFVYKDGKSWRRACEICFPYMQFFLCIVACFSEFFVQFQVALNRKEFKLW